MIELKNILEICRLSGRRLMPGSRVREEFHRSREDDINSPIR